MRLVGVLLVLAAACYKPSPPGGAPCDPIDPHCPSGQSCFAGTCGTEPGAIDAPLEIDTASAIDDAPLAIDARLDAAVAPDAPVDAMVDAMVMIDAPPPPLHLDYPATVAVCLNPMSPTPTACSDRHGITNLVVDGADLGHAWNVYLRFDLDGQLAGRTTTTVNLVVTTTDDPEAEGPQSGDLWRVTPFTGTNVFTTVPSQLGGAPLVASFGPIVGSTTYTFTLPVGTAVANQPIYLGILPINPGGVHYWSNAGAVPVKLHIDTL